MPPLYWSFFIEYSALKAGNSFRKELTHFSGNLFTLKINMYILLIEKKMSNHQDSVQSNPKSHPQTQQGKKASSFV